ncbi:MAG: helix-turn-helix transcriptional regulator [Clostridia bacterium]|nr:helix-turn-helix transcriptional regulator [Clostridia bacterium]
MTLGERIKIVRKGAQLKQYEFAKKIGVAANTVTNYESDMRTPIEAIRVAICKEFGIHREWLETGEGPKDIEKDDDLDGIAYDIVNGERELPKKFLRLIASLDDKELSLLEKFIDILSKIEG